MEYETFEDLYNDNKDLIDFEFKSRFFELFNKILDKINWFQKQEHEHIDGGNCSATNDYYRNNILKLEKIYQPLYNYVHDLPDELFAGDKFPMIMSLKHEFVDLALPNEHEIDRDFRGKPEWRGRLHQLQQKQMRLADMLEGAIVWAYKLGCKDLDKEPKDVYSEPEHLNDREFRLRQLQSYAHNSCIARMMASLYDMGFRDSLKNDPENFEKAAKRGLAEVEDFMQSITKKEEK